MEKLYKTYSEFLAEHFTGKIQKIAVNIGMSCPNRDGTIGKGGCTYCNNQSFVPDYCQPDRSVTQQLEDGKSFFARKYPEMRYLAYFQAYSNTYASVEVLRKYYEEALGVENIVGLVIATRPDCVSDELLNYLGELSEHNFVMMEYGVESCTDRTLKRINRGHDFACSAGVIRKTASKNVHVGAHLILGLPGESREEMLRQADEMSVLPVEVVKLHQLQILKGTKMEEDYHSNPSDFHLFAPEEYARLVVEILRRLRPDIAVERFTNQSPPHLLATEGWGLKNHEFVHILMRVAKECQDLSV